MASQIWRKHAEIYRFQRGSIPSYRPEGAARNERPARATDAVAGKGTSSSAGRTAYIYLRKLQTVFAWQPAIDAWRVAGTLY